MKIIADRKMQRLLEGMSNKDPSISGLQGLTCRATASSSYPESPSISALRGITLPEGYNSNERSKIHCEITMPERLLLKYEIHQSNKPEDREFTTKYLEGAMKIIAARKVQRVLEDHTPRWARP